MTLEILDSKPPTTGVKKALPPTQVLQSQLSYDAHSAGDREVDVRCCAASQHSQCWALLTSSSVRHTASASLLLSKSHANAPIWWNLFYSENLSLGKLHFCFLDLCYTRQDIERGENGCLEPIDKIKLPLLSSNCRTTTAPYTSTEGLRIFSSSSLMSVFPYKTLRALKMGLFHVYLCLIVSASRIVSKLCTKHKCALRARQSCASINSYLTTSLHSTYF